MVALFVFDIDASIAGVGLVLNCSYNHIAIVYFMCLVPLQNCEVCCLMSLVLLSKSKM